MITHYAYHVVYFFHLHNVFLTTKHYLIFRVIAFSATITVDKLIKIAATAGVIVIPNQANAPAANYIAIKL